MSNGNNKILIADDDTDLLKMYSMVFVNSSFEVTQAQTLQKTQSLIKENHFDAIIADILFPEGDILPILQIARSQTSPNKDTPIILLTNLDTSEKTKKALEYGATECLFKAKYTPHALFDEVVKILGKGK